MHARRMSKGSAPVSAECGSSSHASVSKAADDSVTRTNPKHEKQKNRSRNKVPKSIRFDLENSLIGLCDVWFEEIKPHLVRNNIKLHMHGDEADAASSEAVTGCGSGDYEKRQLPGGAPYCPHIDPGAAPHLPRHRNANYVASYSTQPTVSKAPCPRLPAPNRPQRQAPQLPSTMTRYECAAQNQRHNYNEKQGSEAQRPYTIAVHINNKIQTSKAVAGADRRGPRPCSSVAKTGRSPPSPSPTEGTNSRGLQKSVLNKVGVVGQHSDFKSLEKHLIRRFQKVTRQ